MTYFSHLNCDEQNCLHIVIKNKSMLIMNNLLSFSLKFSLCQMFLQRELSSTETAQTQFTLKLAAISDNLYAFKLIICMIYDIVQWEKDGQILIGNIEELKNLITNNYIGFLIRDTNINLLSIACENNSEHIIKFLSSFQAVNENWLYWKHNPIKSPLVIACEKQYFNIVKILYPIKRIHNNYRSSPLLTEDLRHNCIIMAINKACYYRCYTILKYLINRIEILNIIVQHLISNDKEDCSYPSWGIIYTFLENVTSIAIRRSQNYEINKLIFSIPAIANLERKRNGEKYVEYTSKYSDDRSVKLLLSLAFPISNQVKEKNIKIINDYLESPAIINKWKYELGLSPNVSSVFRSANCRPEHESRQSPDN